MDMVTSPDNPDLYVVADAKPAERTEMRLVSASEAADPRFVEKWNTLCADASEPNPFFEPWCLLPALRNLHEGGKFALYAFIADGRLRGLMPVRRDARYYGYRLPHAAVWLHDNAFCGAPLVAKGHERDFWHALFARLDRKSAGAIFLHLPQLPADGPIAAALDEALQQDGRRGATVEHSERAMLASNLSPEEYLSDAMSAKKRKELRRQFNRLAECGELTLERREDAEDISDWANEFLALEAAGWKGEAGSALASSESTRVFFTQALNGAAEAARLERLALRIDGRAVAMLVNFVADTGAFSFKTTFDEEYARFSPGLLLQLENLALLERDGFAWADSCAAEGHSMIERIWREKRPIVSRNIAIGGTFRRTLFRALTAYEMRGKNA